MARIAGKLLSNTTGGMMLRVAVLLTALLATSLAVAADRVVSLGGSVTEIVYALGAGDRLVADDASSMYPEAATRLPRVGYYRNVSLEGILSQEPDLVLASDSAGPPHVLERVRSMGVPMVMVPDEPGVDSLYARVRTIADALGVSQAGAALQEHIRKSLETAQSGETTSKRALVVVHRGGPLMAAGSGTSVDALLQLAGLRNVMSSTSGYKPLSEEALLALEPDIIFTTTASVESAGGIEVFRNRPGVAATPAAKQGRVRAVDDLLLLGMGPRVGEAVVQLREAAL